MFLHLSYLAQASKLLRSCGAALALLREQLLPLLGPPSNTTRSPGDLELELLCCVEQTALADAQVCGGVCVGVTHTPAACIILGEPQEDADPHLQYLHAAYITSTFAPL